MLLVQNNNGTAPDQARMSNDHELVYKKMEELQRSYDNHKVFYENALQKSQDHMQELQT